MPTYDYQCRSCGAVTEVIHAMTDDGPSVCEACGGALRRVLYPAGIIFKGSGFYRTDSRSSSTSGDAKSGAAASDGSGTGASATESKPSSTSAPSSGASSGSTSGSESAA